MQHPSDPVYDAPVTTHSEWRWNLFNLASLHPHTALVCVPGRKAPCDGSFGGCCRWIVPYAKQFKFICLSHIPFMPRSFRCWATNRWLKSVYAQAGIEKMSPQPGSAHNFTGQCNDAFFQLSKTVCLCPQSGRSGFTLPSCSSRQFCVAMSSGLNKKIRRLSSSMRFCCMSWPIRPPS